MRAAWLGLVLWATGVAVGGAACSSAGNPGEDPTAEGGSGGTTGGGSGAAGEGGAAGKGGGISIGGQTGGGGETLCQAKDVPGKRVPANILIVLDRSGSMDDAGKWPAATSAINAMLTSADPELGMGILRFPEGACSNPLDLECECTDISDTPNVPVGPLKSTGAQIQNLMATTGPNGGTPTLWALRKAYKYMAAFEGDGERYVLLVTDGDPTLHIGAIPPLLPETNVNCGDLPDLAKAPTEARTGKPPVRTFVIGAPGVSSQGLTILSGIAQNGGTCRPGGSPASNSCHYQIGSSNFEQDLEKTLNEIAGSVSNCTYSVPAPTGEEVDPDKVNVVATTDQGDQTIYKDTSHTDGWDYTDDNHNKIQIFGPQCDAINQGTEAKVTIGLGCQTKVK